MKKKYLRPEVEYISLEVEDVITDILDPELGGVSGNPDWED